MRILAAVAGLVLIVAILIDCFQSMILPRRVTWRWRPATVLPPCSRAMM
ncbi:MAG TPA: hypothetical protein VMS17_16180 [Gemmataceae bacterium]|nr:hypothetical protein [Gemmataceae bacterium]